MFLSQNVNILRCAEKCKKKKPPVRQPFLCTHRRTAERFLQFASVLAAVVVLVLILVLILTVVLVFVLILVILILVLVLIVLILVLVLVIHDNIPFRFFDIVLRVRYQYGSAAAGLFIPKAVFLRKAASVRSVPGSECCPG